VKVERSDRYVLVLRVVSGIVLGLGGGFVAVELGTLGLGLLVALAIWSGQVPPRFAQLAAVLVTAGVLWVYVFVRAAAFCAATPSSCSGPPAEPFIAVAAVVFLAGIVMAEVTRRQLQRPRDIQ
jgi:hypothetical protein